MHRSPWCVNSASNMSKRSSPGCRRVALGRDELEPGLGVDEPADQPGRGDTVDVHAFARHPGPPVQFAQCIRVARCCSERSSAGRLGEPRLELGQQPFERPRADLAPKKSIPTTWASCRSCSRASCLFTSARFSAAAPRRARRRSLAPPWRWRRSPRRAPDRTVRVPRWSERPSMKRASHSMASPPPSEISRTQPLEILLGLLVRRQRVDRVLHGDRAQGLQPAPDLDAEIGGLRAAAGGSAAAIGCREARAERSSMALCIIIH